MLKQDLILQITNEADHNLEQKNQKVIRLKKQIMWKNNDKVCRIDTENVQLFNGCSDSKNEKGKKKSAIYLELKFEDYKRFLETN